MMRRLLLLPWYNTRLNRLLHFSLTLTFARHSLLPPRCEQAAQKAGGYVKPDTKFMVTNQLEILPSSSMKALIALEMIRSERVGDLDTMEVLVVAQEVIPQARSPLSCRLVECTINCMMTM